LAAAAEIAAAITINATHFVKIMGSFGR